MSRGNARNIRVQTKCLKIFVTGYSAAAARVLSCVFQRSSVFRVETKFSAIRGASDSVLRV